MVKIFAYSHANLFTHFKLQPATTTSASSSSFCIQLQLFSAAVCQQQLLTLQNSYVLPVLHANIFTADLLLASNRSWGCLGQVV